MFAAGRFRPLGDPEPINLKALGGSPVLIRPGSSDPDVLIGAFDGRYHLPAGRLDPPEFVWDLGTNIGLTILQMAREFPAARFVSVELDGANFELAERNFGDARRPRRADRGARSGPSRGRSSTAPDGGSEDAFRVSESGSGVAAAVPLDELREQFGPPGCT